MTDDETYNILISGGGTGGHIFPAVAIADALKASGKKVNILFVGAKGRMEMEKVPAAGYEIVGLPVAGIQRRMTTSNLALPFKIMSSLWQAFSLVRKFKPDIAIGTGGYASGPVLFVAAKLGIPIVIQEQNAYAGVTNKILGKNASRICVAYEGMDKYFPKESLRITGNPTRSNISSSTISPEHARQFFGLDPEKTTVLVIGGSLGARTINESILQGYKELLEHDIQILWQTGKGYFEGLKPQVAQQPSDGMAMLEFIKEMDKAYAAADVIVSRAGAISISELCIVGKPVILVPSPNVAEDHQTKNAMALVEKDAAIMVKDSDSKQRLVDELLALISNPAKQTELAFNIKKMGRPDATGQIVKEVLDLLNRKKSK